MKSKKTGFDAPPAKRRKPSSGDSISNQAPIATLKQASTPSMPKTHPIDTAQNVKNMSRPSQSSPTASQWDTRLSRVGTLSPGTLATVERHPVPSKYYTRSHTKRHPTIKSRPDLVTSSPHSAVGILHQNRNYSTPPLTTAALSPTRHRLPDHRPRSETTCIDSDSESSISVALDLSSDAFVDEEFRQTVHGAIGMASQCSWFEWSWPWYNWPPHIFTSHDEFQRAKKRLEDMWIDGLTFALRWGDPTKSEVLAVTGFEKVAALDCWMSTQGSCSIFPPNYFVLFCWLIPRKSQALVYFNMLTIRPFWVNPFSSLFGYSV